MKDKKYLIIGAAVVALLAAVALTAFVLSTGSGTTPPPAPPAPPDVNAPTSPPPAPPEPAPAPSDSPEAKTDLIRVTSPRPNEVVSSPLRVTGEARGTWYFEASFPVKLVDANGNLIVQGHAEAQSDWMTTEFVPFVAVLEFSKPATATGTLVLEKDNPSGLPEHADQVSINVRFSAEVSPPPPPPPTAGACRPTGCSGQVCSDEDVITTCEFRPEYACYRTARCERQPGGACGWTMTPELVACLANPPAAQ